MSDPENTAMGPPRVPHFENRILGAALIDADALANVAGRLRETDFYVRDHGVVFSYLKEHSFEPDALRPDLVAHTLTPHLEVEDPYAFIAEMVAEAVPAVALDRYVDAVRKTSQARQAAHLGHELRTAALDSGGTPAGVEALLNDADRNLQDLIAEVAPRPWETLSEIATREESPDESVRTLPTGFLDLDRLFYGGFKSKQLVTVAGRPAMGKSTIAMDFARNMSVDQKIPGLFISLEMSASELLQRVMAAEAGVSLSSIRGDTLTEDEVERLENVRERVESAPLYIVDASNIPLGELLSIFVAAKRFLDIEFVVVDYQQQVLNAGHGKSREREVSEVSSAFKAYAKKLDIVVISVAQLNRGPEQRSDHRPQTSDLRESGQLEQDSDIIMLLYRAEYYSPDDDPGEAEVIVSKHRSGPVDTIKMAFQGQYSRFASLSYADEGGG